METSRDAAFSTVVRVVKLARAPGLVADLPFPHELCEFYTRPRHRGGLRELELGSVQGTKLYHLLLRQGSLESLRLNKLEGGAKMIPPAITSLTLLQSLDLGSTTITAHWLNIDWSRQTLKRLALDTSRLSTEAVPLATAFIGIFKNSLTTLSLTAIDPKPLLAETRMSVFPCFNLKKLTLVSSLARREVLVWAARPSLRCIYLNPTGGSSYKLPPLFDVAALCFSIVFELNLEIGCVLAWHNECAPCWRPRGMEPVEEQTTRVYYKTLMLSAAKHSRLRFHLVGQDGVTLPIL